MRSHKSLVTSQAGMVSIMVTMIMMIVISLIVLGFAQVSRREESQVLDRQLSTQAFFAAETGVNDARQIIKKALVKGDPVLDKSTCAADSAYGPATGANPLIDDPNDVEYTCLLVNTKVTTLDGIIGANDPPLVLAVEPEAGVMSSFHITWDVDGTPNPATCTNPGGRFTPSGGWTCSFGILKLDIIPTNAYSRAGFETGQHTTYLYPRVTGSGTATWGTINANSPEMKCTVNGCTMDITGVTGSGKFLVKASALYRGGRLTVAARNGGPDLPLVNGQVQVDVTGRAKDVLRRIQVRLPLTNSSGVADNALVSGSSICKHFQYDGTDLNIPNDFKAQDAKNPTCVPN